MKDLTICIPVYKRLDFVKSLVESVPEEYPVCISDNGNYIKDDIFCRGNVRIKHLDTVVPMFSNWNQAIDMVDTNWFIMPGDDDVIYPEKYEALIRATEKYPDCAVIAFGYDIINENDEKQKGWCPTSDHYFDKLDGFLHIQRTIPYRSPAIVVNTAKSRSIGNYDEGFAFTASDSLYLQHLSMQYPIAEINEIVAGYRMWENNYTSTKIASKDWFDQLELWIRKLAILIDEKGIVGINMAKMHDLVIFDNLMYALSITPHSKKKDLISSIGWPRRVGLKNHLRMIKSVLK